MGISSLSIALATLCCALSPAGGCMPLEPDNIILRSDAQNFRRFPSWGQDDTVVSVNGKCRLTLRSDGNLILERKKLTDGEWWPQWESGEADEGNFVELNDKGKLKIFGKKDGVEKELFSANNPALPGEEADYYIFRIGSYPREKFGDWRQKCDLRIESYSDGVCREEWVNACDDIQENIVMRSDDKHSRRFYAGVDNAHVARNGKCRLRLGLDGNLLLEGRKNIQTENWMTYWESGGGHGTERTYAAALTKGGDLRVIDESEGGNKTVVFSTHSDGVGDHESLYHELSIVTSRKETEVPCRLKLWNSPNEETDDRCSERWTNVKYDFQTQPYWGSFDHSLYTFDVLQQGEMFVEDDFFNVCSGDNYPICQNSEMCPYVTLYLKPNCDLIMFDGETLADKGNVFWRTNTGRTQPVDCYLLADENDSSLKLIEGKYNKKKEDAGISTGKVIWSMHDPEPSGLLHVRLCANGPFV